MPEMINLKPLSVEHVESKKHGEVGDKWEVTMLRTSNCSDVKTVTLTQPALLSSNFNVSGQSPATH